MIEENKILWAILIACIMGIAIGYMLKAGQCLNYW
jgi:uncharacterized membrane protein